MKKPSTATIRKLAENKDVTCISFYMPTARAGKDTITNPTRLKNQLSIAKAQLQKMGYEAPRIAELLDPLESLLGDYDFWQHQEDGLALLRSEHTFERFPVPHPVPELVLVGHKFHLKPLLPYLNSRAHFYVLALSQGNTRLFEADEAGIKDISPDDMPKRREDYAPLDDPQRGLNENSGQPQTPEGDPYLHGHGLNKDQSDALLRDFLQAVDRAVRKALPADLQRPLILAGTDPALGEFRKVTKYKQVAEEELQGAPDRKDAKDLHSEALPVGLKLCQEERDNARERLENALNRNGHGRTDLEKILTDACSGRVDTLFVALDEHRWGNYDLQNQQMEPAPRGQHCSQDLLDFAAVQTIVHGGQVFPMLKEEMPRKESVAALLRY